MAVTIYANMSCLKTTLELIETTVFSHKSFCKKNPYYEGKYTL